MSKNKQGLIVIVLLTVLMVSGGYALYNTGMTVISVSQIYVSPEGGSEVSGKWVGSYWNILATVSADNKIAGLTLPENQTSTVTIGTVQKTLKTGTQLTIQIYPQQPYFVRKIVKKDVLIAPETARSWGSHFKYEAFQAPSEAKSTAVYAHHYEWAEPTWRRYTPYLIYVSMDGKGIGMKTINAEGVDAIQTIETEAGIIRIEHLGTLQSEYMTPETPAQIAIFDQTHVFDLAQITPYYSYDNGLLIDHTSNIGVKFMKPSTSQAYSTYWFSGFTRWASDSSPCAVETASLTLADPVDAGSYGGWINHDDSLVWRRDPIAPPVYSSDKSAPTFPAEKRGFLSLLEYFDYRSAVNLADSSKTAQTIFSKYQGWSINTTSSEVRLNVPWGAYATPLVNIRVPTEMVDTWVEQPQISNVQPTASWMDGGKTTVIQAGQTVRFKVCLQQKSPVQSSTAVVVSSNESKLTLYPLNKIVSMAPNTTLDTYFDVTNNNPTSDITAATILVRCLETYMNTETGRDTLTCDLKASRLNGTTTLNVLCVEKSSQKVIVGLQLQVQYAMPNSLTKSGFTDEDGQQTFQLDLPSGGSYWGEVQISTEQTVKYQPAYRNAQVSPGVNSVTVEVLLVGEQAMQAGDWTWLAYVVAAAALAFAAFTVLRSRKKRRQWR